MLVYAILIMVGAGLILGFILGIASEKLVLNVDPLIESVTELLPGFNCGGCGYPGCANFAKGIVNKEVATISTCRPSNADQRDAIKQLLDTTPDANGDIINIRI